MEMYICFRLKRTDKSHALFLIYILWDLLIFLNCRMRVIESNENDLLSEQVTKASIGFTGLFVRCICGVRNVLSMIR